MLTEDVNFTPTSAEKIMGAVNRALLCLRDLEKHPRKLKPFEESFRKVDWLSDNPFVSTWKEMEFIYNEIRFSGLSDYFLARNEFMLDAAVLRYVVLDCDLKQSNALNRKTLSQNLAGLSENARREKRSDRAGFMWQAGNMHRQAANEQMMAKLSCEEEELLAFLDKRHSNQRTN